MKTFNSKPVSEPITFVIDDDEFTAIPATQLPGGVLDVYFKKVKEGEIFDAHIEFFRFALTEDSFKIFEERFNSKDKPITLTMLSDVSTWLLGSVYMGEAGDTASDQNSSSGPQGKRGRGSTAGAASKE
jgi:hypothetical protein